MSISQWPCQPESLAEIMDEDLIRYILAGAAEEYRLPLAIIDGDMRYDPFNPRQQASPFCRRLRGGPYEGTPGISGAEEECKKWDDFVAQEALRDNSIPIGEPRLSPCWLTLSDYIIILTVGHHRFVLFTGQFVPAISKESAIAEIRRAVQENLDPSSGRVPATEQEIEQLLQLIPVQPIADDLLMDRIRKCSQDIQQQFQNHWQLRRDAVEDEIHRRIVTEAELLGVSEDKKHKVDWEKVDGLLAKLCDRLGCQIAILFAHESHRGRNHQGSRNVLRLRASHGLDSQVRSAPPHFNWNKSRISEQEERCILDPFATQISQRGIRGGTSLGPVKINLWHSLSDDGTGCRSVIGLGGFQNLDMVRERAEFLDRLLSALSRRIHGLQLYAEVHHAEELNMELAEFLAHQVRSRLQTLYGFRSTALRFSQGRKPLENLTKASACLSRAIEDLAIMAKVVHAEEPILYDPGRMNSEEIGPWSVIEAAIEDQAAYAEEREIEIRPEMSILLTVRVDPFWFRIMLGHLLNNAIKYSRQAQDGRLRWITVAAERVGDKLCIYIENFGLGILREDMERIFEPGVTASEKGFFRTRSGHKRGLYEARRIALAHGGTIEVVSRHHTGSQVQPANIEECITTFIVRVPLA
jgi:signal transduction histidine kinase